MLDKELIRGSLRPIIMKILLENHRMYGYQITCRVRELTGNRIPLEEGALYPVLHKLLDENILEIETEIVGKRERRFYSLSGEGKSIAAKNIAEFREFIETITLLLGTVTPAANGIN